MTSKTKTIKKWVAQALCLLTVLVGSSCSSNIGADVEATGMLHVLPIGVKIDEDVQPMTRSVDETLQVDIMQGSTVIRSYDAGSKELDGLISLPVGNYTLYAHTPDMGEAANDELGAPAYSVSRAFSIIADKTTTLGNLEAVQANVGVLFQFQEDDFSAFTSFSCTLTSPSTGRSVTIPGVDSRSLTYFNVPSDGVLRYSFRATNQDGETFISATKEVSVSKAGNIYVLVNWD